MKEAMIQMALMTVNTILVPALKQMAAETEGKFDDIAVDSFIAFITDPRLADEIRKLINA